LHVVLCSQVVLCCVPLCCGAFVCEHLPGALAVIPSQRGTYGGKCYARRRLVMPVGL
jgi:hypothetical protein